MLEGLWHVCIIWTLVKKQRKFINIEWWFMKMNWIKLWVFCIGGLWIMSSCLMIFKFLYIASSIWISCQSIINLVINIQNLTEKASMWISCELSKGINDFYSLLMQNLPLIFFLNQQPQKFCKEKNFKSVPLIKIPFTKNPILKIH